MAPESFTVLVTGFGPFGDYKINSSWIAVKELAQQGLGTNIDIVTCEIPVEYDAIDQMVPKLWADHNPQLVIHVGLSGIARTFTLEQLAHNHDYNREDVQHKLPADHCCKKSGVTMIKSSLDMKKATECCKQHNVSAVVSKDAGRFLCEYIYYTSLSMKKSPVAFIHVPPLDQPYSKEELGNGLKEIILVMIKMTKHKDTNLKNKIVQNLPIKLST